MRHHFYFLKSLTNKYVYDSLRLTYTYKLTEKIHFKIGGIGGEWLSFQKYAEKLLELIGGKENVVSFTHCATRMRFVLADREKGRCKKDRGIAFCKREALHREAGFQVIIGNKVSVFFDEFSRISRMDGVDKQEVKAAAKGKMNLLQSSRGPHR